MKSFESKSEVNDDSKFYITLKKSEIGENRSIETHTLLEFALWATGFDYDSIQSLLNRLQKLIMPDSVVNYGILHLINDASRVRFLRFHHSV